MFSALQMCGERFAGVVPGGSVLLLAQQGGILCLRLPLAQLLASSLLWCLVVGILGGFSDRDYKGSEAFFSH